MGCAYYATTDVPSRLYYVGQGSYGTWNTDTESLPARDDLSKNKAAYYVQRRFNATLKIDDRYSLRGNALVEYDWEGNELGTVTYDEYIDLTSRRQRLIIWYHMKWWRLQAWLKNVLEKVAIP